MSGYYPRSVVAGASQHLFSPPFQVAVAVVELDNSGFLRDGGCPQVNYGSEPAIDPNHDV